MIRPLLLSLLIFLACEKAFAQTTYYSKPTGALNVLSTWGTNTNGTGTSPANFTSANCTYVAVNNTAPTITGNWSVTGANSKVIIGDGTQSINFTVPFLRTAAATFSVMVNSTLTSNIGSTVTGSLIHVNGTLVLAGGTNPTLGTLAANSTVIYSRPAAQTVVNATYGNLTLSGFGAKTLSNISNTTVNGALTINSWCTFVLNTNTARTCTLNGTLSGAGTITGGSNSRLLIGGSGNMGTLNLTGGVQTLYSFEVNRAAMGLINLNGSLTVSTIFTHSSGVLALNSNALTLNGTVTLPASAAGSLSGSATSTLSISATSITNALYFTPGSQTLNSFSYNSNGITLTFGTDLTANNYTQTSGNINLNGNTVTVNALLDLPPSAAQGTTTGSATSNLIINATTISNGRLFMTAGAETFGNFTLNSPGQTLRLGSSFTVTAAFTHSNGTINLSNQSITLNGTATFPASAANGTLLGNTTSNLTVNCSSITNRLYFTTGAQALRNLTLNAPGQTLGMGTNLTLSGTYTHTSGILDIGATNFTMNSAIVFSASAAAGSISGSATSTITIGGTGAISNPLFMTQSGTASYLNSFTLNRAGASVTLGNTLNMVGTLTPTAGTFASAGYLVLRATSSTNVGRIGTIGATGSVTGNVRAQMYAKGGNTGWTLLGSPGLTGRTFSDWDDNTSVTCLNCPDGYFNFTSIYSYSETVGGLYDNSFRYIPITNVTDAMTIGQGYWMYLGNSTTTSTDIILDVFGPVNQGNFNFNLTFTPTGGGTAAADHGYNLICNPYPSPILWSSLRNGNPSVANAIYVYNPDLNGHATYVNGISSPAVGSGGIGNAIPAGQGFYVKANAATTLTAQETNKSASTQEMLKLAQPQQNVVLPCLMRLKVAGNGTQNETVVYFDANATTGYDTEYDALYLGKDAGFIDLGTRLNGFDYAINALPALTQSYSIPVFVKTDSTDTYTISAFDLQTIPAGACIRLHDNYTGLDQDLRTGTYSCTVRDTEKVAARFVLNITISNTLTVSSSVVNASCSSSGDGMLVASGNGSGPWNYYWKDTAYNLLKTTLNQNGADTLFNLNAGTFLVDVNTAGTCDNATESLTLLNNGLVSGSFTPSSATVTLISDSVGVTFTNTSSNADSYWWEFGDGMGSSCYDTTHYYMAAGEYTVTLYAINQNCSDTAVYSEIIQVIQGNSTGLGAMAGTSAKMFISRDAGGYYIRCQNQEATGLQIRVHNLIGEELVALNTRAKNEKVYITLPEPANEMLIISAVSEKGEKTFVKIVH